MKERLLGAFILGLGLLLGYWSAWEPLSKATAGADEVSLFMKGAIFAPLFIGLGAMYLLLGPGVKEILGSREEPSTAAYVIGVLLVIAGFALYFGVKSKIEDRGYKFEEQHQFQRSN